jgi:hypothetical protein
VCYCIAEPPNTPFVARRSHDKLQLVPGPIASIRFPNDAILMTAAPAKSWLLIARTAGRKGVPNEPPSSCRAFRYGCRIFKYLALIAKTRSVSRSKEKGLAWNWLMWMLPSSVSTYRALSWHLYLPQNDSSDR